MKISYTVGLFLIFTCSFSQKKANFEFGKIPMEEMQMTVYKYDSSASAVYLLDYEESNSMNSSRHVRIKILKPVKSHV